MITRITKSTERNDWVIRLSEGRQMWQYRARDAALLFLDCFESCK